MVTSFELRNRFSLYRYAKGGKHLKFGNLKLLIIAGPATLSDTKT
jgi:hypothetical protein